MASKIAHFKYYETFEKIADNFKTVEERESFRSKVVNYGLHGKEPASLTRDEQMVWDVVKDLIDEQTGRNVVKE